MLNEKRLSKSGRYAKMCPDIIMWTANRSIDCNIIYEWGAKVRMRLCTCAGWSESANFAHVPRHVFAWCGKNRKHSRGHTTLNQRRFNILTPRLVLFLICLYISSPALSKVFEHRNYVSRALSKGNQSYYCCESCATIDATLQYWPNPPLVTIDASLQYWPKHLYTYLVMLVRHKMICEHCSFFFFFFFFTFLLPDELLCRLYHSNTFVLLLLSILYCWHVRKQK